MQKVMQINIYFRHIPGKCYTFQHESLGKRYTFSMKVREFLLQNKVAALYYGGPQVHTRSVLHIDKPHSKNI